MISLRDDICLWQMLSLLCNDDIHASVDYGKQMNKQTIIEFFDRCAPEWDEGMIKDEDIISIILDNSGVHEGTNVLDVACGTGVLFDDYLHRDVASLTAIDISPKMIDIAKNKYPNIEIICGDVEEYAFDGQFDVVMVYNAFPHFPNPERLIARLASLLKQGGRLSIAHGMSREALHEHHKHAMQVSLELPTCEELAKMFATYFDVDIMISNDKMYQVCGVNKN